MTGAVVIELDGYLSDRALRSALSVASEQIAAADDQRHLLVDCSTMTGYDASAREMFVDWNSRHKTKVKGVAVVTQKTLWHVVVSAMALASGQRMKAFDSRREALLWIESSA
jgi:hypothetical protein